MYISCDAKALLCINYARFQVPVPDSGSCIAVSLHRFLVVAFRQTEITYLGECLTQHGVKPDADKIKGINDDVNKRNTIFEMEKTVF
jgi:hypothetical protein